MYDDVMRDVDYRAWAAHILNLCDLYELPHDSVLNIACGTGSLDVVLSAEVRSWTGIDGSAAMIERARAKMEAAGRAADYHVGRMESFDLGRAFDLTLCLYDSINYVIEEELVRAAFCAARRHTRPGGGYIVDITTEHNIIHNFSNYTFAGNFDEYSYIWENDYKLRTKICHSRLTMFLAAPGGGHYTKAVEDHVQRMYDPRRVQRWLRQAGFDVLGAHDGLTTDPMHSRSERIHFVCRRPAEQKRPGGGLA